MDEGQLLAYPELVRRGAIPNLDFESSYGPANLWVLSLAFELFGAGVITERSVGLGYRLLIVLCVFALARVLGGEARTGNSRCDTASVAALTAAAFLAGSGCHAYAWFGGMLAAVWSVFALQRGVSSATPRALLLLLAGALGAVAVSFRLDLGLAIVLSALPLVLGAPARGKLCYGLGLVLGLGPLTLHVARIGIDQAWQGLFVETVLLAGPGRHLPLPPRGLLRAFFFFTAILAVLGLSWLVVRALVSKGLDLRGRLGLALAGLSLGALPQLIQRADVLHAIDAACIALPLCPVAALLLDGSTSRTAYRTLVGVGAVIAVVSASAGVRAALGRVHWLEHGERRFPLEPELAASLGPVLREVDRRAADGDRLFVGPADLRRSNASDTFVYFMLPRLRPASYYTEMNPGVANAANSSLAQHLQRADFLILTNRFDQWSERNASSQLGPEAPRQVVDDRFCRLLAEDPFELWERCDRLPAPQKVSGEAGHWNHSKTARRVAALR